MSIAWRCWAGRCDVTSIQSARPTRASARSSRSFARWNSRRHRNRISGPSCGPSWWLSLRASSPRASKRPRGRQPTLFGSPLERTPPARASGSRRPAVMPPPAAAFGGRFGTISAARPMAIATASLAVLALLLAGAVLMSRQALPGDALYGLKRADENVQLSLAGNDTAKGRQYLKQATNRADEVSALLRRASALAVGSGPSAAGTISAHTVALISGALNSGDADTRDATRLLGTEAVEQGSSSPLAPLTSWAPEQRARLQQIAAELPDGLLHARAVESSDLVTSALARAQTLSSLAACHCVSTTTSDSLGPVPCGPCDGRGGDADGGSGRPGARRSRPRAPDRRAASRREPARPTRAGHRFGRQLHPAAARRPPTRTCRCRACPSCRRCRCLRCLRCCRRPPVPERRRRAPVAAAR